MAEIKRKIEAGVITNAAAGDDDDDVEIDL